MLLLIFSTDGISGFKENRFEIKMLLFYLVDCSQFEPYDNLSTVQKAM